MSLYPPRHPTTTAILKNTTQGTLYNIHLKINSVSNDFPGKKFRILQSLIHKQFNVNMSVHQKLLADKHPNQNPGCSLKRNCIKSMVGFKECSQNFQVTRTVPKWSAKCHKNPEIDTISHNCSE